MRRTLAKGAVLLLFGLCPLLLAGCRPDETTTVTTGQPEPAKPQPTVDTTCMASQSWISQPNPPGDVAINAGNCEFHQFSWQWFLKLVSPLQAGSTERVFEDNTQYPVLGVDLCPGKESSLQLSRESRGLGIRIRKQEGPAPFDFILPADIEQAGSDEPLFDQNGKVVYYSTQYTPNECGITQGIDTGFPNKPGDTVTELKLSWRQIEASEAPRYFNVQATIEQSDGSTQQVLLGLVGFHLVKNAPNHPEFIWASFEHKDNAPDCDGTETPPASGWSFASAQCAACLNNPYEGNCTDLLTTTCRFNLYQNGANPNICRAIPNGGGSLENQTNIQSLNTQVAGFLGALAPTDPMAVFQNYFLVGTLWIKNPKTNPGPWIQDGSTTLLNTTMESYDQLGGPNEAANNCFTCHDFNGPENTTSVSHILPIPTAQKASSGTKAQAKK